MKNSGIIFDLGDGRFGIATHASQRPEIIQKGKICLFLYSDRLCTKPILDETTKLTKIVLKDRKLCKAIGFSD